MNSGSTLILDAFWVDNKHFPTIQYPNCNDGQVFYDYYYGTARHLGWMDMTLLKTIIKKHHITHIILQNLDTLGKIANALGEAKVCTAYKYNKFHIIISHCEKKDFSHYEPLYESVVWGGWDFSDDDDEIPIRAQEYMRYILIHSHVNSITTMTKKVKVTAHFDALGNVVFDVEPNS